MQRLRRSRSRRKGLIPLVAALEACTASDSPHSVVPLDLAGFLLRYLDDNVDDSHPLMHTAEHQLVRWSTLVGSMEVESPSRHPTDLDAIVAGFEGTSCALDSLSAASGKAS